tara:strand:- start:10 stop:255 length:246 start_codon:yes stop_codon:yes gene_type:complete
MSENFIKEIIIPRMKEGEQYEIVYDGIKEKVFVETVFPESIQARKYVAVAGGGTSQGDEIFIDSIKISSISLTNSTPSTDS